MRIDFPQGVPDECIAWLNQHVGPGTAVTFDECAWFYERRFEPSEYMDIPSITIKDGSSPQATMFVLRWSGP